MTPNRLKEIIDTKEGLFHSYAYDHTGERILKRYGSAQQSSFNGKDMGTLFDFGESYSAYVSPYFVETNNGYTKHYYAGATRLVSKIGEGVYQDSTYISYGEEEKDQYFYFQDHLGSSTYITTLTGEVAQYAAYTPYGELFREYRNVTPYKFNGKELDAETGLYYYGARYYNPATALWLGVDPLASKYPSVSPYVYCHSNPINRIDPDGRSDINQLMYLLGMVDNKGNIIIDNTFEAVVYYYIGNGDAAGFGVETQKLICNSEDVQKYQRKIENGETHNPADGSGLPVNLTYNLRTYHIGRTTLNYSTTCNEQNCITKYSVGHDGFWDPNIFSEEDGKGPNGEFGGNAYDYIPFEWEVTYPNPGYKIDTNNKPLPISTDQ